MSARFKGTALMLAALSAPAFGQMVVQADAATLQPQIGRDDKGFSVCGVRAIVMDSIGNQVEAHDFSVTVRAEMFLGLLKAGKSRFSKAEMAAGKMANKTVLPAPTKFWIALESEAKAVTPLKIVPAETPGFVLEVADIVPTYQVIFGMIHGERVQFATRYKNEKLDRVLTFSAKVPEHELKPLMTCLQAFIDRMREESK
jgi:hypothetical protein